MSDLLTQLQRYGDQIESEVPVFSLPADFASDPGLTKPGDPAARSGGSRSPRPRWMIVAIAMVGLLILLALLFAIFANRDGSDDSPTPAADAAIAEAADAEPPQEEGVDRDPDTEAADAETDDAEATDEGAAEEEAAEAEQPASGEPETSEAESGESETAAVGAVNPDSLPNLPCGEPGTDDSSLAADADPRDASQRSDFTLNELLEPTVLELIEVGGSPCHQLRGAYESGMAGPQTLAVWVTLAGASNSLYQESYDGQRRSLEIIDVDSGFVHFAGIVTEHIKLFDYAPIVLPVGVPVEYVVGVTVEELIHVSGVERAFKTSDDRIRGLTGIAPVPSVPVGVGAVWETKGGEARYEVIDVTGGVVTIAATFGGATPGSGTIWLQPDEPLKTADEYWTDVSGGGINQRYLIQVNERPCLRVEKLTVPRPFGGLTRGADYETTMRRAGCGFGEPSAVGELRECRASDGSDILRREVSWGSLTLHFEVVAGRETFVAFTYETDDKGWAEPGGPQSSALELPGNLQMGMTLQAAETLLGVAAPAPADGGEPTRIVHPDIEVRAPGPDRKVTRIGVPSIPECA